MIILSKSQVQLLHTQLIEQTGGIDGIRDDGLLDSALCAPFQSFDGIDAFPSIQQKAARLGFGLVKNHPFVDGNKRVGAMAALVFLDINGLEFGASDEDFTDVVMHVASGKMLKAEITLFLKQHSIKR